MEDTLDVDRALIDPVRIFGGPKEVVCHPGLSFEQKQKILQRWALAAYRVDLARTDPFGYETTTKLDEIIDALIDLDEAGTVRGKTRSVFGHEPQAARPAF